MPATLTERYIAAAVKSLPPDTQKDVRDELAASIADAVEARIEHGEPAAEAERAVLAELGDPAVLAAGYAERPLHLIGPRYYLAWWRLLKLLLWIVPASVFGALALGLSLADEPIGTIIGQSLGVAISVAVHLCVWVTVVFVIFERTGADTGVEWTLDDLPEPEERTAGRVDLIASLVLLGLFAGAVLWDGLFGFSRAGGESMPVLAPGLWPWWAAALLALLAAEALLAVLVFARGRWTAPLAIANTAVSAVFISWVLTLLGRQQLINPEFIDRVLLANGVDQDALRILAILLGFFAVGISAWDSAAAWVKHNRSERALGTP